MGGKVETPEVLPAARGRGRPPKFMEIAGARTLPERIEKIGEFHESARTCVAQGAMYAVLCGVELLAAKAQLPHGQWEDWVEENCPFNCQTAWRYMRVAEAKLANLSPVRDLLSLPPHELSDGQRKLLLKSAEETTRGQTLEQLYLALGFKKERELAIGGRAILIAWLAQHYPNCKARKEAALPPEIRVKWQQHLRELELEAAMHEDAQRRSAWSKLVSNVAVAADRKLYQDLPRAILEHTCRILGDVRQELLAELKRQKEG